MGKITMLFYWPLQQRPLAWQTDSEIVNENVCGSVYIIQQNKEVIDRSIKLLNDLVIQDRRTEEQKNNAAIWVDMSQVKQCDC